MSHRTGRDVGDNRLIELQIASGGDHALAEHIRSERVRFVFIQSALPIIFSPLAAAILSLTLRDVVSRTLLIGWTSGLALIAVGRFVLVRVFANLDPDAVDIQRWEGIFIGSIVVVDLWWGIGALLILPGGLTERAVVFCFVMLMAGGHTASYSAHPATVLIGMLALTVPITVAFALRADTFHAALAFVAVMFMAASFRSIKTLGFFFNRSHRLAHELKLEKERAEALARIDPLTSLLNRRAFYEQGEQAIEVMNRYGREGAVLMLDIDHFKSINDRFGHAAGDRVIRSVADGIREQIGQADVAGRLGGEEFAVLLPQMSRDEATAIAERIRTAVEIFVVTHERSDIPFTVSVGVADRQPGGTLADLLARADEALYRAKRSGRNRVMVAEVTVAGPASLPPETSTP